MLLAPSHDGASAYVVVSRCDGARCADAPIAWARNPKTGSTVVVEDVLGIFAPRGRKAPLVDCGGRLNMTAPRGRSYWVDAVLANKSGTAALICYDKDALVDDAVALFADEFGCGPRHRRENATAEPRGRTSARATSRSRPRPSAASARARDAYVWGAAAPRSTATPRRGPRRRAALRRGAAEKGRHVRAATTSGRAVKSRVPSARLRAATDGGARAVG
ncbi:hypothetical protein JL721_8786 [Aureococcus anophagefferens]|nr:hypothetical protein JL721_8786 [Aureococcus anophagefferens]